MWVFPAGMCSLLKVVLGAITSIDSTWHHSINKFIEMEQTLRFATLYLSVMPEVFV